MKELQIVLPKISEEEREKRWRESDARSLEYSRRLYMHDKDPEMLLHAISILGHGRVTVPKWLASALYAEVAVGVSPHRIRVMENQQKDHVRWCKVRDALNRGLSWPDAYADASVELEGTKAAGDDDAIKKSYSRCQKRFRSAGMADELRLNRTKRGRQLA